LIGTKIITPPFGTVLPLPDNLSRYTEDAPVIESVVV